MCTRLRTNEDLDYSVKFGFYAQDCLVFYPMLSLTFDSESIQPAHDIHNHTIPEFKESTLIIGQVGPDSATARQRGRIEALQNLIE